MNEQSDAIKILQDGGVGVLATDTLYGIVGSALHRETVERIYTLRKRDLDKPMIILIGDIGDIEKFDIVLAPKEIEILNNLWPNKISVVLDCHSAKFEYLHRGKETLAFRLPADRNLRAFLKQTGPLVAPSANTQGNEPAKNIAEAKNYFGNHVDFYLDGGTIDSAPSTIVSLKNGELKMIREGAMAEKISQTF
jgi:L-threonylcarbamoyladenylate synthase